MYQTRGALDRRPTGERSGKEPLHRIGELTVNIVPCRFCRVKAEPVPNMSAPRLRADTRMFLGHIASHIESLLRRAQRGDIDVGCPQTAAALTTTFILEQAPEFLELHSTPVGG